MAKRSGFTLIEVLITITIMVVLLTLTVVILRGNQVDARDEQRATNALVIAQQLENRYISGGAASAGRGYYPPTLTVDTESEVLSVLRDLDKRALRAPDVSEASPMSFSVATGSGNQTPTISRYIYQPLTASGNICQSSGAACVKFIMWYRLEADSSIKQIQSRNQ